MKPTRTVPARQDPPAQVLPGQAALAIPDAADSERTQLVLSVQNRFLAGRQYSYATEVGRIEAARDDAESAFIRMGMSLSAIKELEPKHRLDEAVTASGLSERQVQRLLAFAREFADSCGSVMRLGQNKLAELKRLPADLLDEVKATGTIDGDEVDRMPLSELRRKVRGLKEEKKRLEERIEDQGKTIMSGKEQILTLERNLAVVRHDGYAPDEIAENAKIEEARRKIHDGFSLLMLVIPRAASSGFFVKAALETSLGMAAEAGHILLDRARECPEAYAALSQMQPRLLGYAEAEETIKDSAALVAQYKDRLPAAYSNSK